MQTGGPPDPVKQLGTYNPDPIPEGADEVDGEADTEGDVVGVGEDGGTILVLGGLVDGAAVTEGDVVGVGEDGGTILVLGGLVDGAAVGLVDGQISSIVKHLRSANEFSPSAFTCTHAVPSQHLSQAPLHNPYSGTQNWSAGHVGEDDGDELSEAEGFAVPGLFVGLAVDGELLGLVVGSLIGDADGD